VRLLDVDGQEVGLLLPAGRELLQAVDRPPEGGSSEAPEDEHEGSSAVVVEELLRCALEREQRDVGGPLARPQGADP
jgi:hypothetical protein